MCVAVEVWVRSYHIKVWKSASSRSCLTAVPGWLNRQQGVKVGDGLMFGQNGLLYDSNVFGVLAASGLERNSFPSHSFRWHLSLVYASPRATTLHPSPPLPHPPPQKKTSPCRERGSSSRYDQLSRLTVTGPGMQVSLSPVSWRARLVPGPNIASVSSPALLTQRAPVLEKVNWFTGWTRAANCQRGLQLSWGACNLKNWIYVSLFWDF